MTYPQRILLCGEGPHDIGRRDWDSKTRGYIDAEGWMQPLTRRGFEGCFEFGTRRRAELLRLRGAPSGAKLPGHGEKARLAKFYAASSGFDIVIFMADADSRKKSDWSRTVREIEAGFAAFNSDVRSIACVPMATSESWLLSDEGAWHTISGKVPSTLPPKPEEIWGERSDPNGNHPHQFFSRVCGRLNISDNHDTRAALAEKLDLKLARERCPTSLEPFLVKLAGTG